MRRINDLRAYLCEGFRNPNGVGPIITKLVRALGKDGGAKVIFLGRRCSAAVAS
jgi:hypothetical protein